VYALRYAQREHWSGHRSRSSSTNT
jgi:hypothetical protein